MMISLIGMSGTGKTYWGRKLEQRGFRCFCCDDLIERKLGVELKNLDFNGIGDVAKWLGQPFEEGYHQASQRYLFFENEVVKEALTAIEKSRGQENVVVDTTGSVIYLGKEVLKKLASVTRIVYLEVPPEVEEKMYRLYLTYPKPVIWGGSFKRRQGEANTEALKRCYPNFLKYRAAQYRSLAWRVLDYHLLREPGFSTERFLEAIKND